MSRLAKVRELLKIMHQVAVHLTEEEISDIGKVIIKALSRLEEEAEHGQG